MPCPTISLFGGRGNPQVIRKDGWLAAREQTPFSGYYTKESEHPYTNAPTSAPQKPYKWTGRSRILGGRTLHWGRQSFRLGEFDFKAASIDGYGVDWPFTYADLASYYDKVEDYVGIQGFKEGLPQIPDGRFLPPFAYNCFEHLIRKAAARKSWRMTALRTAQLSRYHRGRPPCHYCGSCGSGCDVGAFFSSIAVTLPDAANTGKLTLLTDAVVREVVVDKEGRVRGVSYIDRKSKVERKVQAKVVVLAAGTLESTRILLNSVSRFHPRGMANESGVLGHYLTDHFTAGQVIGVLPELVGSKIRNDDGKANGSYIPRYSNLGSRHLRFIRGYGIMVKGGSSVFPGHADLIGGFGAGYKKRIKKLHPAGGQGLRPGGAAPDLRQLCGDRQGRGGRVGNPGPEVPLPADRQRLPHAGGRLSEFAGTHARGGSRDPPREQVAERSRGDHPRDGNHQDGPRSAHQRPEPVLPGPRDFEPVRHGRRLLAQLRLPESYRDHSGNRLEVQRLSGRGVPEG